MSREKARRHFVTWLFRRAWLQNEAVLETHYFLLLDLLKLGKIMLSSLNVWLNNSELRTFGHLLLGPRVEERRWELKPPKMIHFVPLEGGQEADGSSSKFQ